MPNIRNANITSVQFAEQSSDESTPISGYHRLYIKSDGAYIVDENGYIKGPFSRKNNYTAIIPPTVNDDIDLGYEAGSRWIDTVTNSVYECLNNTSGAAIWVLINREYYDITYVEKEGSKYTTIQSAIDSVGSTSETIRIGNGFFDETVTIDAGDNFIYLRGNGTEKTVISNLVINANKVIASLDIDSQLWQSGNTIRITFAGSPDLSIVTIGDKLYVSGSTNSSNDGTFTVTAVDDISDYVDITNSGRSDATDDETSSPATGEINSDFFQNRFTDITFLNVDINFAGNYSSKFAIFERCVVSLTFTANGTNPVLDGGHLIRAVGCDPWSATPVFDGVWCDWETSGLAAGFTMTNVNSLPNPTFIQYFFYEINGTVTLGRPGQNDSVLCNIRGASTAPISADDAPSDLAEIVMYGTNSKLLIDNVSQSTIKLPSSSDFDDQIDVIEGITAGVVSPEPTLTDNGDGSVTIDNFAVFIFDNDHNARSPKRYNISGNTFTLTDNQTNYITVSYNSGSPILQSSTTETFNSSDIIPVFDLFREGTYIAKLDWNALGNGLTNKMQRYMTLERKVRISENDKVIIGEDTGRVVTLTSGIGILGCSVPIDFDAFRSDTDTWSFYYHVASVWTKSDATTQYNNTQYDNGTNLVNAAPQKYLINWAYRGIEDEAHGYYVLGTEQYSTLAAAEVAQPRANLPEIIKQHTFLVGRIIVQTNATTASSIESAFDTTFVSSTVINHNDSANIQLAGSSVTYGHIDDQTQTIAGEKTFTDRLGIGTTTPAGKLHVVGDILATTSPSDTMSISGGSPQFYLQGAAPGFALREDDAIDNNLLFVLDANLMQFQNRSDANVLVSIPFSVDMTAITQALKITQTEIVVNETSQAGYNVRFESNNDANQFFLSGDNNSITIGSATKLAKFGISGNADELQFVVKAHATQTAPLAEWQTGTGEKGVVISPDAKEVRWYDSGASNYVGLGVPALTANQTFLLPASDGDANDVLTTDGNGVLSFATPTSGSGEPYGDTYAIMGAWA